MCVDFPKKTIVGQPFRKPDSNFVRMDPFLLVAKNGWLAKTRA